MFKDKKSGDIIHILEIDSSGGKPTYHTATVSEVSEPKYTTSAFGVPDYASGFKMEIKAELKDGTILPFAGINPDNNFAIGGKYRISTEKERIHEEVKRIYEEKSEHVSKVDQYKEVMSECESIMQELGVITIPRETDARLEKLESNVNDIKDLLKKLSERGL